MTNPNEIFLSRTQQAKRWSVSKRSVERWGQTDELGLPSEIEINGRHYRKLSEQLQKAEQMRDQIATEVKTTPPSDADENTPATYSDLKEMSAMLQIQSQVKANELEIANRQQQVKTIEAQIDDYQKRINEARRRVDDALAAHRDDPEYLLLAARVYADAEPPRAQSLLGDLLRIDPANEAAALALSDFFARYGRAGDARSVLDQLLVWRPESTDGRTALGLLLEQMGRPDDGTDVSTFNNAEFLAELKPAGDWRPQFHKSKDRLISAIQKDFSRYPGIDFNFSQNIQDNVEEAMSGVKGEN